MNDEEIEIAAKAMQNSKAWPVVFQAGAARELARAASDAVLAHRINKARQEDQAKYRQRT